MEQSNVELWTVIVGFALPVGIAALNRRRWSSTTKGLVAFAACVVVALAGTVIEGTIETWRDPVRAFLVVFVVAIGIFHLWWRPSGIVDFVETKTG